ncbi:MAG: Eco57I restriction-modification methylase domain-containing protein, partial [Candidatus Aminicenantia bacterium]
FIVLLTDFEEFRLFDASLKPNPKNPEQGLIFDLKYTEYLKNLDKLLLLSKEEVQEDSLDRLLLKDTLSKKLRIPVDKSFLEDMSRWREELAKDIYKRNQPISVRMLNEVVQKILDRFIFIRIAEDRKIIDPKTLLEIVELWKAEGKRKKLQSHLNILFRQLNEDFNGEILKPHACEIVEIDSHLLAKIIENFYFSECIYKFDVIGVELLGSIYERYLGKTIRVTPKRVKVEEKPEVRKAGGVYYTPKYIVDYIVKNTVGKIIKGKTPKQISKIKILDPACGSGSFLLSAFQTLIDYHLKYYTEHPEDVVQGKLFPDIITDYDGTKRLSIERKTQILTNNIFGVDIDPQAVEIAMMSLYLKCLEGEKDLPRKKELLPSLAKNIRCGNSLISYDIFDQPTLFKDEEKERINPFDWYSKSTGFGKIMEQGGFDVVIGNPPYINVENLEENVRIYLMRSYETAIKRFDIYIAFLEKGIQLLKNHGRISYIIPYPFLNQNYAELLRKKILSSCRIETIVDFSEQKVFEDVTIRNCILVLEKQNSQRKIDKNIINIVHPIGIKTLQEIEESRNWNLSQKVFTALPKFMFRLELSKAKMDIIEKIQRKAIKIGELCYVNWGARSGNIKKYVTDVPIDIYSKKMINARNIDRYSLLFDNKYLWYKKKELYNPMFEELFENEKLIIRDISGKNPLKATFDNEKYYAEHTVSLCQLKYQLKDVERKGLNFSKEEIEKSKKYNLKYILGLINAKVTSAYFHWLLGGGLHVYPDDVKNLPIRTIDFNNPKERAMHDKIVKLVDKMLDLNKKKNALPPSSERERIEREIKITDEKIDELVYELYGITEKERKTIEGEE